MKKGKIVGIQKVKDRDFIVVHILEDADSKNLNLVGQQVHTSILFPDYVPDGLKVGCAVNFFCFYANGRENIRGLCLA